MYSMDYYNSTRLDILPTELILKILSTLSGSDLLSIASSCRWLNSMVFGNPTLWKLRLQNKWPQWVTILTNSTNELEIFEGLRYGLEYKWMYLFKVLKSYKTNLNAKRRIVHEILEWKRKQEKLEQDDSDYAYLQQLRLEIKEPLTEMFSKWTVFVLPNVNSVYCGARFRLDIEISESYPFKPPVIKFMNEIYHPNWNSTSNIYLPVLHDQWSPALKIFSVMKEIMEWMENPTNTNVMNKEAWVEFRDHPLRFRANAQDWVNRYAL